MEQHTATWVNLFISWLPFLLLIGFWVFFMKKVGIGEHKKYRERHIIFMERQEQLLERIASALERANDSNG